MNKHNHIQKKLNGNNSQYQNREAAKALSNYEESIEAPDSNEERNLTSLHDSHRMQHFKIQQDISAALQRTIGSKISLATAKDFCRLSYCT